eukprot:CAMPEP_0113885664 /NCGR_PEP_ID=MMETSP0780_2-20120614/11054_1 /TAXON_ID=652834 /ORGANISM="Palpitomonas bilix" /LENGTH=194 /DNA_ID=CAMNT_0000873651 /DNA_START=148 /DNA_END=728 /DNA_ORIENTATION=+ /assembly_acc=CAM_ASM_000599
MFVWLRDGMNIESLMLVVVGKGALSNLHFSIPSSPLHPTSHTPNSHTRTPKTPLFFFLSNLGTGRTDSCLASFAVFQSANTVWSVPIDLLQNQNQDCFKAVTVTTTAEASNNPSTWKMVADPSHTATVEFGGSSLTSTVGECTYTFSVAKGTVGGLDSGVAFTAAETTALNGITTQVDNIKAALAAMHQGEGEG